MACCQQVIFATKESIGALRQPTTNMLCCISLYQLLYTGVSCAWRGSVRVSMAQHGSAWLSVAQRGSARVSMAQRGSAWVSMGQAGLSEGAVAGGLAAAVLGKPRQHTVQGCSVGGDSGRPQQSCTNGSCAQIQMHLAAGCHSEAPGCQVGLELH